MDPEMIEEMIRVLRPVLTDRQTAKKKLERYWSDKIAIVWTAEQVHRAANECEVALTDEEARRALEKVLDRHDRQYSLKWEDITNHIQDRVLGRKLTISELHRFIHADIITIQKPTRSRRRT